MMTYEVLAFLLKWLVDPLQSVPVAELFESLETLVSGFEVVQTFLHELAHHGVAVEFVRGGHFRSHSLGLCCWRFQRNVIRMIFPVQTVQSITCQVVWQLASDLLLSIHHRPMICSQQWWQQQSSGWKWVVNCERVLTGTSLIWSHRVPFLSWPVRRTCFSSSRSDCCTSWRSVCSARSNRFKKKFLIRFMWP